MHSTLHFPAIRRKGSCNVSLAVMDNLFGVVTTERDIHVVSGYMGILLSYQGNWGETQVFADLVVACSLIMLWICVMRVSRAAIRGLILLLP
jgi:hypothetical protein